MQLDSALQDVNVKYAVLEETEKRAVCRALIEERGRFCSFVSMLRPVLVSPSLLLSLTDPPLYSWGRAYCWIHSLRCSGSNFVAA